MFVNQSRGQASGWVSEYEAQSILFTFQKQNHAVVSLSIFNNVDVALVVDVYENVLLQKQKKI